MRNAFVAGTPMPVSTYDGVGGLEPRNDLAGLNLTTVPKVLIECGNMQNGTDAALLVTPAFQQEAAAAMAEAITQFLTGSPASIGRRRHRWPPRRPSPPSGARTTVV